MTKPIVITGGCGYIGSRIAARLAGEQLPVVVVDKATPEERGCAFSPAIEFRKADLRIAEDAQKVLRGAGVVLHLAANVGPLTYMQAHQADILQENAAIDAALYPALVHAGAAAVIYASSSMVYQRSGRYPYQEGDERQIPPPTNVYGFSKLIGEYFCRAFHAQRGLPFVIIRYHNVYGPGEDSKGSSPGDIHVIPALIEKAIKGDYPLEILGDPEATRPFTYIDDAVDATVRILELMRAHDARILHTDINIGPREATRILDLGKKIWELCGDGRPFAYRIVEAHADTAHRREMDAAKIERLTGWKPKTALEEGIRKTADWVRKRKGDENTLKRT